MKAELKKCCGSEKWVNEMMKDQPYSSMKVMLNKAEEIWRSLDRPDILEAFHHHPKIGDMNSLKKKYAVSADLSESEQSGAVSASENTLAELAQLNSEYEKKFGFIFIVFATGKTAEEMLSILKERINNDPGSELKTASDEQLKITKLRLKNYYESDHNSRT